MKELKKRDFPGSRSTDVRSYEIEHRKLALEAAREGIVLLENKEGILPLSPNQKLALFGAAAVKTVKGGTGSGDVNEREVVSIYQGMLNMGFDITTKKWLESYQQQYEETRAAWRDCINQKEAELIRQGYENKFFEVYSTTPFRVPEGDDVYDTDTDTAIMVIGRNAGENADRRAEKGDYYLTEKEESQIKDLCSFYENVIIIINAGGIMDLSFIDLYPQIKGLLVLSQPGMEGGNALAEVLCGKVNPSGKLTDSWAYRYEDYPNSATYSHNNGDLDKELYLEGIYVGYRYFDSFDIPVRYGFGYGLSYSSFEMKLNQIEAMNDEKGTFCLKIDVTNTGSVAGKEVVQVYTSLPDHQLAKERRRLVAFGKTGLLQPGESEIVTVYVTAENMASYEEYSAAWVLDQGNYGIYVGNSLASSTIMAAIVLECDKVLRIVTNICPIQEKMDTLTVPEDKTENWKKEVETKVEWSTIPVLTGELVEVPTVEVDYTMSAEQAGSPFIQDEASELVDQLTEEQLILLATGDPNDAQGGALGTSGISVPGSAGETSRCAKDLGIANIVLADGPAGLRLNQIYYVIDGETRMLPFRGSVEQGYFNHFPDPENSEKYYQYCTAMPVGTMLAQTWNMPLLEKMGDMIGEEMEIFGVQLWLAPGMNIHRNPLCGRNFEYFAEDPLVSGKCAAALTRGVQSHQGLGTTIKHFACNNLEDNRMASDSILHERTLREIYLRGFEIAVKEAQPMSIMTSYNLINGIHTANSYDLCTKVARCEFGFQGTIMTDWTTTNVDEKCTAAACMRAGNDLVMPGMKMDHDNIREELAAGTLSRDDLKACVTRLVRTILKTNCYE